MTKPSASIRGFPALTAACGPERREVPRACAGVHHWAMASSRHVEIERKYAVASGAVLPAFGDGPDNTSVAPAAEIDLEAVYFDTADLDLLRHGVTLRRRTGGEDAGWHLKLPGGKDTRTEIRLPLGRAVRSVPTALLTHVRALVRDQPLSPVARVSPADWSSPSTTTRAGCSPRSATTTSVPKGCTAPPSSRNGVSGRSSSSADPGQCWRLSKQTWCMPGPSRPAPGRSWLTLWVTRRPR